MMSVDADGIVHTLFEETRGHCWAASRHVQTSPLSPSPPAPLHFFPFFGNWWCADWTHVTLLTLLYTHHYWRCVAARARYKDDTIARDWEDCVRGGRSRPKGWSVRLTTLSLSSHPLSFCVVNSSGPWWRYSAPQIRVGRSILSVPPFSVSAACCRIYADVHYYGAASPRHIRQVHVPLYRNIQQGNRNEHGRVFERSDWGGPRFSISLGRGSCWPSWDESSNIPVWCEAGFG